MSNKNIEALIECPFYSRESGLTLICEGVVPNTCLLTRFSSKTAKLKHLKNNCYYKNGGDCFLAKSLFDKYETDIELPSKAK